VLHHFRRLQPKTSVVVLSFSAVLATCIFFTSAAQSPTTAGLNSIRADELREKLTYIASEKFKGRGNGTRELNQAAEYIAGIFERNGLKPAGTDGKYFQTFDMYTSNLGPGNSLMLKTGVPSNTKLKVRADFIPEAWSVNGTVAGQMVFVDKKNTPVPSVKGKIAVVLEGTGPTDDPEFPQNATVARGLENDGAIAVIVAEDPSEADRNRIVSLAEAFRDDLPTRLTAMGVVDSPEYPKIPVIVVSSSVARDLIPELRPSQPKVEAAITVDVQRKTFKTQNVLGLVEGTDPNLKADVMIVGAHYDHDGEANGQIWYGADDNGSGTSALLEIAEAFGTGTARPARSVLLCAFTGEEKGMLGSRYYVSHPAFPLNRTVAMFQLDMVGRNEDHSSDPPEGVPEERAADNTNTLNILGSAFSPDLKTVISGENEQVHLIVRFRYDFKAEDLLRRSDQWSFLARRIPAVFFFTGLHPDYHTPRDTAAKINYPKLEKVTKLAYLSAFQIANAPSRPAYVNAVAPK
jgi:Zn-dependent M28 family amino/carboxypeptidase